MNLIDKNFIKFNIELLKRNKYGNKYDYGHVLVIAGSYGMAGACIMCIKACIRSGVGLVTAAVPKFIIPIVQSSVPQAICIECSIKNIKLNKYDSIVLGPGIGVNSFNQSLVEWILLNYNGKLLIDADGLNIISLNKFKYNVKSSRADIIITPHEGESKRLIRSIGLNFDNKFEVLKKEYKLKNPNENKIDFLRENIAKLIAYKYKVTVVLKGAGTLIVTCVDYCSCNYEVCKYMISKNSTGNSGMAMAGTGDILAGIIGALLAQGIQSYSAAAVGVYIHGLAGDLAAAQFGQNSMTAEDIILNIKI